MSAAAVQPVAGIVIGTSTGGVEALIELLRDLPPDYPLPVLVVLHLPPEKTSLLSEVLSHHFRMRVVEAQDKQPIMPGVVYCAPPDYHMTVEPEGYIALSLDPPVNYSRPSIDVLFESAAYAWGQHLLGILLTGASHDGAEGLSIIHRMGGTTWTQDLETANSPTMPAAGLRRTGGTPLTLAEMALRLAVLRPATDPVQGTT